MNDNDINIAIAEACGWTRAHEFDYLTLFPPSNKGKHTYRKGQELRQIDQLPNYCTDLNAMHEAWLTLEKYGRARMSHYLGRIKNDAPHWECENATARQRAEAFLRTLGKWKD